MKAMVHYFPAVLFFSFFMSFFFQYRAREIFQKKNDIDAHFCFFASLFQAFRQRTAAREEKAREKGVLFSADRARD